MRHHARANAATCAAARSGASAGRMIQPEPITLEGRGIRLEPLALEHRDGLATACADGKLWEL